MTAAEATGSAAGLYSGYLIDAVYTVGTGDLGSLNPANASFRGLISYSSAHVTAAYSDKTVMFANAGYTPTKIWINGKSYNVTNIASTNDYTLNGLDGSVIKPGRRYFVNSEITGGVRLYPDVVLKAGLTYIWDGIQWTNTDRGQTAPEVNALIKLNVPQQFRNDAVTTGQYFQPSEFWSGTAAQEATITKKTDGLYFIHN